MYSYQMLMRADDTVYPEKGSQAGRTKTQHTTPWAHRDLPHPNIETHAALLTFTPFLARTTLKGDQVPRCYSAVIFFPSTPTLYIKNFINQLCAN